jgi:hypothetical protein
VATRISSQATPKRSSRLARRSIRRPRQYLLRGDRVIDRHTGELIRELILDPTRDFQPRGLPQALPKKAPECNDVPRHLSTVSRDITVARSEGFEPPTF